MDKREKDRLIRLTSITIRLANRKDLPVRLHVWQMRRLLKYEDRLGTLGEFEYFAIRNAHFILDKEFENLINEWKAHEL